MQALRRIAPLRNGGLQRLVASSVSGAAFHPEPWIGLRPSSLTPCAAGIRHSSSNSRWKQRQGNDYYAREAKVQGLKSRAAFKLLEMDAKYKLFRRGQTVIDLGYAPGSWSQVAQERTKPHGRVVGIDLLPAQPPRGVSTIQGNFLSPAVQALVKEYLQELAARKPPAKATTAQPTSAAGEAAADGGVDSSGEPVGPEEDDVDVATLIREEKSYIDVERGEAIDRVSEGDAGEKDEGRLVDLVLSDMSAPWPQTSGFSSNTISNPYHRLMNTSGMSFRDHAGSMDLCLAALQFASDTLKTGGHFVCKFYQGSEDKDLELKLKKMFVKVHREKPDSSRNESKEAYFVALRRKGDVTLEDVSE